jgi:hypothetical protein
MKKGTHKDISGKKLNRLTAISYAGQNRHRAAVWLFSCSCGGNIETRAEDFLKGKVRSCGCMNRENLLRGGNGRKHGLAQTAVYWSWAAMLNRCYNTKIPQYKDYGGRGIRVCEFLRVSPGNLLELLGNRTRDLGIDRIDNDKHYTCGQCSECLRCGYALNVCWSTAQRQAMHTRRSVRVKLGNDILTVLELSKRIGVTPESIYQRIRKGINPCPSLGKGTAIHGVPIA